MVVGGNEADWSVDRFPGGEKSGHYEMLIKSLQRDHRAYVDRILRQKSLLQTGITELQGKQERLQTALMEATREVLRTKTEKDVVQMRLEEVQSSIEGQLKVLRQQIDDVNHPSHTILTQQNEELRATVEELKVICCYKVVDMVGQVTGARDGGKRSYCMS